MVVAASVRRLREHTLEGERGRVAGRGGRGGGWGGVGWVTWLGTGRVVKLIDVGEGMDGWGGNQECGEHKPHFVINQGILSLQFG